MSTSSFHHVARSGFIACCLFISSCSVQRSISRQGTQLVNNSALKMAHVGVSVFDVTDKKYVYNYQGDKYFVPASNTKIPTCYAAMKYLGDSLVAFRYLENDTAIFLLPAGDPSLLHPDYKSNPGIDFLRQSTKKIYILPTNWKEKALGYGWSWDDYNDNYMAERSPLPVFGNIIKWIQVREADEQAEGELVTSVFSEPPVNWELNFSMDNKDSSFFVQRERDRNTYTVFEGKEKKKVQEVPFVTDGLKAATELLADTIGKELGILTVLPNVKSVVRMIHSQPTDSILRPMMHRSDNFFAEQSLLMLSNERLGMMNDEAIIDTLLKSDFKSLPQKPAWVDGSGLSRYNLFTPQDFVTILNMMQQEFGMQRIKTIFPTGNTGTLKNYYKEEAGYIFAKTGTLSGVVAISGFLYTKKNKLLIFSVLVNSHRSSATEVRRSVEKFLEELRSRQ